MGRDSQSQRVRDKQKHRLWSWSNRATVSPNPLSASKTEKLMDLIGTADNTPPKQGWQARRRNCTSIFVAVHSHNKNSNSIIETRPLPTNPRRATYTLGLALENLSGMVPVIPLTYPLRRANKQQGFNLDRCHAARETLEPTNGNAYLSWKSLLANMEFIDVLHSRYPLRPREMTDHHQITFTFRAFSRLFYPGPLGQLQSSSPMGPPPHCVGNVLKTGGPSEISYR